MLATANVNENVRFEPDESPPSLVTIGAGIQAAMLIVAPVVLTVVIVARIAEQPESYMSWGVFAALLVSGVTTVLQAVRVGRIGAGHVLIMGTSGAFIAVCVAALVKGGPSTMASLIVVSSLFQFLIAWRLSLLRRIFTPVVSGTVIMLMAATVMPIVFDTLTDVPDGASQAAAPVVALATMVTVVVLVLRAPPAWRLWSPIIGIAVGCAVAAPFGLYDVQPSVLGGCSLRLMAGTRPESRCGVLGAAAGVRGGHAGGGDRDGWGRSSHSKGLPTQAAGRPTSGWCRAPLNADGVGNLLSGIGATLPNTTYSTSISLAEVTGIAERRVGVVIGGIFFLGGLLPQVCCLADRHPSPGGRFLHNRSHRDALRAGNEDRYPRTVSITGRRSLRDSLSGSA